MSKVQIRNPVPIADRQAMTPKRRRQVLDRFKGKCGLCNMPIGEEPFDVDHRVPLELGGADTLSNWQPLHRDPCHRLKTASDINRIAKAKRQGRAFDGTKPPTKAPIRSRGFRPTRDRIDA